MADEEWNVFWQGKRVLVTGHTGFIGSWLCQWLLRLGADVAGFALEPHTNPSLYDALKLDSRLESTIADLCDRDALKRAINTHNPEIVIHLAAQAIVGTAHADAFETWRVNTLGTVALLEALRERAQVKALTIFSTDKVYDNDETGHAHQEEDAIGGFGIYDSSKGAAEIAIRSFRRSGALIEGTAIIRAGNVIGGGDWNAARLVPDCVRAFAKGQPVELRHPASIRPWQHVLEACYVTLRLTQKLYTQPQKFKGAWNVGPEATSAASAEYVATTLAQHWQQQPAWKTVEGNFPEAKTLLLNSTKLKQALDWQPTLDLDQALAWTAEWYKAWEKSPDMIGAVTDNQIAAFEAQRTGT